MNIVLRSATIRDETMLLNWRNLEEIYTLGSLKKPVTIEEHASWFKKVMANKTCKVFIIQCNYLDCGQVRFDFLSPTEWQISIYLVGNRKNQGIGSQAIQHALREVPAGINVMAHVLMDNERSKAFFEKNGFKCFEKCDGLYKLKRGT